MAAASRGRGDVVLGARHLVGVFALLVVVLGIVFTLGYLLGRSRYEDEMRQAGIGTESAPPRSADAPAALGASSVAPKGTEVPPPSWDFYKSGDPAKAAELTPAPVAPAAIPAAPPTPALEATPARPGAGPAKPIAPAPARSAVAAARPSPAAPSGPAPGGSALIPKGAITLQVAALLRESDALALAQALQEKKFPTIVTTPSSDKYYRVQVGPYPDAKTATAARRDLEKRGFKSIVRR